MFWLDMAEEGKNRRSGFFFTGSSSSLGFPHSVTDTRRHEDVGGTLGVEAQPAAETHISHINPAWLAVISNIGDRCSRIAEHSSYHEC